MVIDAAFVEGAGAERQQILAGDPFNTSTGEFTHSNTDLAFPGKGLPLEFTRLYSSMSGIGAPVGDNWSHNYYWSLIVDDDDSVLVKYPTHKTAYFRYDAGDLSAPAGVFDTLVKNGNGSYTLTTPAQVAYNFTSTGQLTNIVDRNGYSTALDYTGELLTSVTDSVGRSRLFSYDDADHIERILDPNDLPGSVVKTGTFSKATVTGNQNSRPYSRGYPEALILWSIGTENEAFRTSFHLGYGMTEVPAVVPWQQPARTIKTSPMRADARPVLYLR